MKGASAFSIIVSTILIIIVIIKALSEGEWLIAFGTFILGWVVLYPIAWLFYLFFIYPFVAYILKSKEVIQYEERLYKILEKLEEYNEKRNNIVEKMVRLVMQYNSNDSRIVGLVSIAREHMGNGNFSHAMNTIRMIYDIYPNISSKLFDSLTVDLFQIESEIKKEIQHFTQEINLYDRLIAKFPINLILKLNLTDKIKDQKYFLDIFKSFNIGSY